MIPFTFSHVVFHLIEDSFMLQSFIYSLFTPPHKLPGYHSFIHSFKERRGNPQTPPNDFRILEAQSSRQETPSIAKI
jgi:hypothetical protein